MVQISTRVLVAALAAAPALAIPLSQPVEDSVAARDVTEVELDARNPFLGKIFKKVGGLFGFRRDLEELETREFADEILDLEVRDFEENMELNAREFDELVGDLEARNPFLGKIFRKVGGLFGLREVDEEFNAREFEDDLLEAREQMDEVDAREFDELVSNLEARNPFLGKIFKKVGGLFGFRRDLEGAELDAREFDEAVNDLEARNPFLGKIFRKVGGLFGLREFDDELDARDFEDDILEAREQLDEVDARDFEEFVGDLEARNPFLGKIFKKVGGLFGFRRDLEGSEFEAREFDVEEVDARDFFDYEDFEAREIDELD